MSTPSIFSVKNLRKLEKSREGDADDSSSISRLPDEMILQILNKLIDLKTLFFCYLVSRRFSSIVLQVDAISLTVTVPRLNPPICDNNTVSNVIYSLYPDFSLSVSKFLIKFRGVKSFCVELPSFNDRGIGKRFLFKWKAKFSNRIESFMFLSPTSISDKDGFDLKGNDEEDDDEVINDMFMQNYDISLKCLEDVLLWHTMLMGFVDDLPMLETISITDSGRRGRLSLSGKKLSELKEWVHSTKENMFSRVGVPKIMGDCYIPVLNLPVSGFVMKGIYIRLMEMKDFNGGYDDLMNFEDGFEDKEEAVYTEAVMEILGKHKGMMGMFDATLV